MATQAATGEQRSKPLESFWLRRERMRDVHDFATPVSNVCVWSGIKEGTSRAAV
jgi:hypothetical protein